MAHDNIRTLIQEHYQIDVTDVRRLAGYENANYLVKAEGQKFVFKTYHYSDELYELVQAESSVLKLLEQETQTCYPRPILMHNGKDIVLVEIDGIKSIIRMLSFLEGTFFAEAKHSPKLMNSFGLFLAKMDSSLLGIGEVTYRARKFEWDLQFLLLNKKFLSDIEDPSRRKIVEYFMLQFEMNVLPKIPDLRKSIIHNDANDWNVLVTDEHVAAIIDFGDMTYSSLINELAVGIAYAVLGKANPIETACQIIQSYHEILPLEEKEIDLLYYLIASQFCITVCNAAHSKKLDPDNAYISVSEAPAWDALHLWLEINPIFARDAFRKACQLPIEEAEPISAKVERRHEHIDSIVSLSYKTPIYMERAAFQYMYDGYGNTFLDAYNNIPHVGHSHPKVVEAGQKQMAKLNTNTRYVYDLLGEYASQLLEKFPASLDKVYFVNSGSAASDLAIRLARHYTKSKNIMVMEHGYHGHTMTSVEISDYKFNNAKGPGQESYILKAPLPATYRGSHKDEKAGERYAQDAIELMNSFGEQIAAFITEPVVGCGGQVPLADNYLKSLYPAVRAQGGVCISDEVQTGFGRLGEVFWGFEAQDVIPDIVVLGKPMGNGHPLGAVITTKEIADSFSEGVEFFSSFGGNPVSCAIGLEVLNVLEREKLQQNALEVGNHYKSLMHQLGDEHKCIGDIRGSGLFLGFEIVDESGNHDTALASQIKNELRNRHILVSTDGPKDNVIKSKPPLCFSKSDAEKVVMSIEDILNGI